MLKYYVNISPTCIIIYLTNLFDIPVSLELLVAQMLFFLPGPRYDTLSSRLSLVRSGVARRHHVLNVFNQGVTGRRHGALKHRETETWSAQHYYRDCISYS